MWCDPETFDTIDISNIDGVGDLEVVYIYYSDGYINLEVSIDEDDPIIKKIKSKYEWLQNKTVPNSDGFYSDKFYTEYSAYEWFTNYHGFEEEDDE